MKANIWLGGDENHFDIDDIKYWFSMLLMAHQEKYYKCMHTSKGKKFLNDAKFFAFTVTQNLFNFRHGFNVHIKKRKFHQITVTAMLLTAPGSSNIERERCCRGILLIFIFPVRAMLLLRCLYHKFWLLIKLFCALRQACDKRRTLERRKSGERRNLFLGFANKLLTLWLHAPLPSTAMRPPKLHCRVLNVN